MQTKTAAFLAMIAAIGITQCPRSALAAPSAEVAKRCMHYAYMAYPYKRPGSVRGSPDRQNYFKDCMARNGDVPAPPPAGQPVKVGNQAPSASSQ